MTTRAWLGGVALLVALSGCASADPPVTAESAAPSASGSESGSSAQVAPAETAAPVDDVVPPAPPPYVVSDGRPRDATLSIPRLGLVDVVVSTYRGRTDDARGSAIQDTGVAASPSGPEGGTGPGGVGNYQVTGHRTSSSRVFEFLGDLRSGDRVQVTAGGTVYVYEVRQTRITSFRSPQSLREQRAAVPGHPGKTATRAMITLSTCRTPEDHAEGNYWSDEFHNPEHRIDKIGVLVRTRPAG